VVCGPETVGILTQIHNRGKIQDKFRGVYWALGAAFVAIISGISTIEEGGDLSYAEDSFTIGALILTGTGLYILRKRRCFGKTFFGSKILEIILLIPLVLYFIWYVLVHGHEWFNDPNPLMIISTVWSLVSYGVISLISRKNRTTQENNK